MWRGVLCTLVGATLWGFSGSCIQYISQNYEASSEFISCVRALTAAALFIVFLLVTRRSELESFLTSRNTWPLLLVFGVGLYLSQITYAISIALTNAGTATVLQALCTVFIMLITCVQEKHLPYKLEFAGLVCALAAAFLIATQGDVGVIVLVALSAKRGNVISRCE
jgi:drug/metabolite transporter (DMT)-like permease